MSMNRDHEIVHHRTAIHLQNGQPSVRALHEGSTQWVEIGGNDGVVIFFDSVEEITLLLRAALRAAESVKTP